MRGVSTQTSKIREQVFEEVARAAFREGDVSHDLEEIPYRITPSDVPLYRESIWRERAIASERVRLAMGLSLRPLDRPVHVTEGYEESNITEKYYEPPLMQVIPSACDMCEDNKVEVTNMCHGCVAHPCMEVCPKEAISMVDGKAYIDQDKCIKCGKCIAICHIMQLEKEFVLVRKLVASMRSKAMNMEERRLTMRSVFPVVSVWQAAHLVPLPISLRFSS